ncbi:MAG: GNAT family N-acetyltransferase [Cyanobacteriota bacterium]|jgi:hypothetical protein
MAAASHIRPVQYRDLGAIARLQAQSQDLDLAAPAALPSPLGQSRLWHSLIKALSYFPNPLRNLFTGYVAETERGQIQGFIQIAPFNFSRSTWKVETVATNSQALEPELVTDPKGIGSQLLRHCFQTIWEARTWILEIDIQANNLLALYRQNGFQPLAQLTYWSLAPERLQTLAHSDPDLPNLLPVSNADAALLYQLDCVAMPPLLRQVFDRHILDFKSRFLESLLQQFHYWRRRQRSVRGYVFEPQRKAAIGYFQLTLSEDGARPHRGELTVHPAYTWLYPKLLIQMSQLSQPYPPQHLELTSTDYQHEREEYLEQLGAERHRHTLLMSRSVWHKLKETKLERLQLAEVLQGLKPVSQAPIPSRLSLLQSSEAPETAPEDLPHQGWR